MANTGLLLGEKCKFKHKKGVAESLGTTGRRNKTTGVSFSASLNERYESSIACVLARVWGTAVSCVAWESIKWYALLK